MLEGDTDKIVPKNTYGMTKAVCELLVNDYTRPCLICPCDTSVVQNCDPSLGWTVFAKSYCRASALTLNSPTQNTMVLGPKALSGRKGFIDGRTARLPTVIVRPGAKPRNTIGIPGIGGLSG